MPAADSLDKLFSTHFHAMAIVPFEWRKKVYAPKPIHVSPLLARGLGCPPMCGACCHAVELVWLPFESVPYAVKQRKILLNGQQYTVLSDAEQPKGALDCKHLSQVDGRCGIHGRQPFLCDFETLRFRISDARVQVLTGHFGRSWVLKRIDGERGARCEMLAASEENANEAVRRLYRLAAWMDYFDVAHKITPVIAYLEEGRWKTGESLNLAAGGERI